jgi:hypothetical protein
VRIDILQDIHEDKAAIAATTGLRDADWLDVDCACRERLVAPHVAAWDSRILDDEDLSGRTCDHAAERRRLLRSAGCGRRKRLAA